jgi:hypothetical protein
MNPAGLVLLRSRNHNFSINNDTKTYLTILWKWFTLASKHFIRIIYSYDVMILAICLMMENGLEEAIQV